MPSGNLGYGQIQFKVVQSGIGRLQIGKRHGCIVDKAALPIVRPRIDPK